MHMQPHAAERRHLERQITYARPIFMILALGDLLEQPPQDRGPHAIPFVLGYLGVALAASAAVRSASQRVALAPGVPLPADLAALAVFLLLTHSAAAFWFLYLFVALAAGIRWGIERSIVLAGGVTLAVLLRAAFQGGFGWMRGVLLGGAGGGDVYGRRGLAFLGDRNRLHAAEHEFLARLTGMLKVEQGIAESLRLVARGAGARASIAKRPSWSFRDAEVGAALRLDGRSAGQSGRISPESLPLARGDSFLLDHPEATRLLEPDGGNGHRASAGTGTMAGVLPTCRGCRRERGRRSAALSCSASPLISPASPSGASCW